MNEKKIYDFMQRQTELFLSCCDRVFNRIFSSDYNPLYRSGTLAIVFLLIASVTGFVLIFFYQIGAPYESVFGINQQVWFGRWIRALHRYSSDAMVISIFFHILRMFAQKKSWGKRTFAWISGMLLLLLTLLTAWSGFILVWDVQALHVALGVTEIVDSLGVLASPLKSGFDGSHVSPGSSFFFFVVFLHVVIPLGMVFGIWIHTMKMARAKWFPKKRLSYLIIFCFFFLSILYPVPMDRKANLLVISTEYALNWWYLFALPLLLEWPILVFLIFSFAIVLLTFLPFFLKPKTYAIPPASTLDKDICNGCNQCVADCPYEAISLIEREEGYDDKLSSHYAKVNSDLCVSCALCAASCPVFTIGPKGRTAFDQHRRANDFLKSTRSSDETADKKISIIACTQQSYTLNQMEEYAKTHKGINVFPIQCMGTLHMKTIAQMSKQADHIILAACHDRNCMNKDGHYLLNERKQGIRMPKLPDNINKDKVHLLGLGDGEHHKVFDLIEGSAINDSKTRMLLKRALLLFVLIFLLLGGAVLSHIDYKGPIVNDGILRFSWKLQSQKISTCREEGEDAKNRLKHMRLGEECSHVYLDYNLIILINGEERVNKVIQHSGRSSKSSLFVFEEIKIPPQELDIDVVFKPVGTGTSVDSVKELRFKSKTAISKSHIILITLGDKNELVIKVPDAQL